MLPLHNVFSILALSIPSYYFFAYLDPGSGSFILQLILGAIVGLLVAVKAYWGRIKSFFTREDGQLPEEDTGSSQEPK